MLHKCQKNNTQRRRAFQYPHVEPNNLSLFFPLFKWNCLRRRMCNIDPQFDRWKTVIGVARRCRQVRQTYVASSSSSCAHYRSKYRWKAAIGGRKRGSFVHRAKYECSKELIENARYAIGESFAARNIFRRLCVSLSVLNPS